MMPIAPQITNTPVHVTSSSSGITVSSVTPAVRSTNSIDVKYEPGLLSSAATGTINIDTNSAQVVYHSSASGNFIFNFRGDSATSLNTTMELGHTITTTIVVNNGATPYYCTSVQIDGSTVSPKWAGGTAPTAGTASSHDIYSFSIIKTAATPTYLVLANFGAYA
jgi:hypothetical protein